MHIERLYPAYKDHLWGGNKLKAHYGKSTPLTPCAESWELSLHQGGLTCLADGTPLASRLTPLTLGQNAASLPAFPVMIKLIDAKESLSVQVHPADAYARERGSVYGKTELWYIVEAEAGAGVYIGFSRDVTREEYEAAIREGHLLELLNFYPVKGGESYLIPAGTVHAIGRGCLVCEVQQSCDLTYRIFDYGRKDKNGKQRELHVDQALQVTDLCRYRPVTLPNGLLGCHRCFQTRLLCVQNAYTAATNGESFHVLNCVRGAGAINGQEIAAGDSFFIPANDVTYTLTGEMTLLLTEIRKYYLDVTVEKALVSASVTDDRGAVLFTEARQSKAPSKRDTASLAAALCRAALSRLALTPADITDIRIQAPDGQEELRARIAERIKT